MQDLKAVISASDGRHEGRALRLRGRPPHTCLGGKAMTLWEKGRAKTGGRQKGVRNKISMACLNDALESYQKHGAKAWEILFVEKPDQWLKAIISLMPAEIDITNNSILAELPDEQLELVIRYVTRLVGEGLADRLEAGEGRGYETEITH